MSIPTAYKARLAKGNHVIRRDEKAADGSPLWLLIDQVAHARLAGQVAARWRWPRASAVGHEQFLAAIYHHDDGWAAWDAAPAVDPQRHRPLAFTEMPVAVSTSLWTASIVTAQAIGSLATYMVAGHFRSLVERHDSWRRGPDDARRAAENFINSAVEQMASSAALWTAEMIRPAPAGDVGLDLDESLHWLQLFDALSLWLCCADRTTPESFFLPAGGDFESGSGPASVTFTPLGAERMAVDPWPFSVPDLQLETTARVVPARAITTSTLLLADGGPRRQIGWRFEPRA